MRRLLPLTVLVLSALPGCGEPVAIGEQQAAILDGAPDAEHPAVGLLVHDSSQASDDRLCTATLIDPSHALTAAHCVTTTQAPYQKLDSLYFFVGADAALDPVSGSVSGRGFDVAEVSFHPAYAGAGLSDLAVVRLAKPVPAEVARPIGLAADEPVLGGTVTLVGFGLQKTGDVSTAGTRRQATGKIFSRNATTFKIDGKTCHGDSGGPALVGVAEPRITGVHSGVTDESCQTGTEMRVDVYADWIRSIVEGQPSSEAAAVPPGAGYGERCEQPSDCDSHICVTVSRLFSKYSACSQRCTKSSDCPNGDRCDTGARVCAPGKYRDPSGGDDSIVEVEVDEDLAGSGCSVGPSSSIPPAGLWVLALLALLLRTRRGR